MSQWSQDDNPYSPGSVLPTERDLVNASDDEEIRKMFIGHEASIRWLGFLFYVSALFYGLPGSSLLGNPTFGLATWVVLVAGAFLLAIVLTSIAVGRGLRRLQPWSRIGGIALSVIGLLALPIGTLISVYALFVLGSSKSKYVFSPAYQKVIAATPLVESKTSVVVWICLSLVLAMLFLGGLSLMIG